MIKTKFAVLILAFLAVNSVFLGIATAQTVTPSPTPDYMTVPTVSPSPTSSPTPEPTNTTDTTNSTSTNSTNTVDQSNSTYVDVNPDYIQNVNPAGAPLMRSAYNQTTMVLIFSSSVACAVNATGGHWTATQDSAGQIVFYPDELGVYDVHFQVLYNRMCNQTVTLIVYSGDGQQQLDNLVMSNFGFTLDVTLTVSALPQIPTAEEIARAEDSYNRVLMFDLQAAYERALAEGNFWSKTALVVAVVGVVVLGIVLFLNDRHRRHQDITINNLNRNGFDGRGHA